MEKKKRIIERYIQKTAKNEIEEAALREEIGIPTPQRDLPNLKKDRIVLELVNRTNSESTIDLFGLPSGSNSSQNISYGDLFETKYSAASILITEFGAAQTYTINWVDEDGNPQTATTISLDNIDTLISQLILLTNDNWAYYTTATSYVIHKMPVDTWVYWSPVPNGTSSPTVLSNITSAQPVPFGQSRQSFVYGNRQYCLQTDILSYFDYPNTTSLLGSIDLGLSGFGGGGFQWIGGVDASNQLMCYDYNLNRIAVIDISGVPSVASALNGVGASGNWTYDSNYNIWWSTGGTGGASDNVLKVFDSTFAFIDFWAAGASLNLSPITFGENKVLINSPTDYWVLKGRQGSPAGTKGLQKFGGWDSLNNLIIQTTSTSIFFADSIFAQTGQVLNLNDIPSVAVRIKDTNTFFIAILSIAIPTQCYIGTVNTDTAEQNWAFYDSDSLTITGDVYYSSQLDRIIAKMEYGGSLDDSIRTINYNTLEVDSGDLGASGYFAGSLMYDESNNTIFRADNSPQGFYVTEPVGGTLPQPSGAESASFYTENAFTDITADTSTNVYQFSTYDVIGGTGISVTETTGNLTYAELVQALRTNIEPYFFQDMSIYADTISQANTPIKKVLRGMAGQSKTLFDNPTIFHQSKFVTLNNPISIAPKTLNEIDYSIGAFESVTIIINYTKGNLNAIAETLDDYIAEGIPFSVGINQLASAVSKEEEAYLKETLKAIWSRKKKEFKKDGIEIEIEHIFEPQEKINAEKKKVIGKKMQAIKKHIESQRLKDFNLENVSPNNIKRVVANYAAKGAADKMHDPYNYFSKKKPNE